MYPPPPPQVKKGGKKGDKKDNKNTNQKDAKKENKPNKANEKKPTPVLTNGTQAKKAEKKQAPTPVQQNGTAASQKSDKGSKSEVKPTKGQLKTQPKVQTKAQPKSQPKVPVVEISIEAAKRIRNLKKKLKTIDELELKVAEGGKIDKDQRVKISKKAEVLAEIHALETGKLK